jgi:hypothetical protein
MLFARAAFFLPLSRPPCQGAARKPRFEIPPGHRCCLQGQHFSFRSQGHPTRVLRENRDSNSRGGTDAVCKGSIFHSALKATLRGCCAKTGIRILAACAHRAACALCVRGTDAVRKSSIFHSALKATLRGCCAKTTIRIPAGAQMLFARIAFFIPLSRPPYEGAARKPGFEFPWGHRCCSQEQHFSFRSQGHPARVLRENRDSNSRRGTDCVE